MSSDSLFGTVCFLAIFILEYFFPFFPYTRPRHTHAWPNLAFAAINTGIIFLSLKAMESVLAYFGGDSFGLLNAIPLPSILRLILAIAIFDLWMYWWHRINHEIYFFWRFHRVHHTDPAMDSTTALRFHPIEITLSYMLNIIIMLAVGITIRDFLIYKIFLFPVILLHHSNIALPEKWEKAFRPWLVMPAMHRVHHSQKMEETNSNYGSIFPFWDKIFRSFRQRADIKSIIYGIGTFKSPKWQSVKGMIIVPFKS